MKTNIIEVESAIEISREMYCKKMNECDVELVDYDTFLENIVEIINDNDGSLEDAKEIANASYRNL